MFINARDDDFESKVKKYFLKKKNLRWWSPPPYKKIF
jgi:hypothetical protein